MRLIILGLSLVYSLSAFADQIQSGKSCEALIADLAGLTPEGKELDKIRKVKSDLETSLQNDVQAQYSLMGVTQMRAVQIYERALFLLARGDTRELVPLLRPYFSNVYDNFKILRATSIEIAKLRAQQPAPRKEIASLEQRFVEASKPFGEYYGGFIAFEALLNSVKDGKGVDDTAGIVTQRSSEKQFTLLNLNGEPAKKAASRALGILASSNEAPEATVDEIRAMFKHNLHAVIAKLKKDQADQVNSRAWFRRGVHYLANFYLNLTDRSFIPERYRKWLVRLTGIAYDQMMLERYLDKVQAIVEVARNRSAEGNIVLSNDIETLELQTKTLMEFRAIGLGEDLLVTFARLGYHTESWMNLKMFVQKKAEVTRDATSAYSDLAEKMTEAEQRKNELGALPYAYEPAMTHQLIFVTTQLIYLAATEEGLRHYGIPWVQQLMGSLF